MITGIVDKTARRLPEALDRSNRANRRRPRGKAAPRTGTIS
jgi:hypothetical protein